MFQRRHKKKPLEKTRDLIWPRLGLQRLVRYYRHRMGRLSGTPYHIACGVACGVAISCTPFIGFHLLLGGAIAWILRGSIFAMVIGSLFGNPWTLPFIWVATYRLGTALMGKALQEQAVLQGLTLEALMERPLDLLLPMTLGSLPLALVSWFISFYATKHMVKKYKAARAEAIHGRHRKKD